MSAITNKKIIAVMGATGAQGGSVIRAFQSSSSALQQQQQQQQHNEDVPLFEIRAITRNPNSEKAKALEGCVKEIVKADADDEDSLVEAFKGCYGAFVVTDFWQGTYLYVRMYVCMHICSYVYEGVFVCIYLSVYLYVYMRICGMQPFYM